MTFSIEVTRPDDLLRLRIDARNLRLDRKEGEPPSLVVDDAAQPAFLSVHFPPQAIAEGAYYEATIVSVEPDIPPGAEPQPPPTTIGPVDAPGDVPVRMAQGSRLVFKVPAQARIPLTISGLLDWSSLELSVNGDRRDRPESHASANRCRTGHRKTLGHGDGARAALQADRFADVRRPLGSPTRAVHLARPHRTVAHANAVAWGGRSRGADGTESGVAASHLVGRLQRAAAA